MRIAVTYENGRVFEHFGKTEMFKLYDVENEEIVSTTVVPSNAEGHSQMVKALVDNSVDMLICGGIGQEAFMALASEGITAFPGTQGDADEAVRLLLTGDIEPGGANCENHDECSCGEGCGGCCGSEASEGCGGGCGGCCGGGRPAIEGPNVNKNCVVHYVGTFDDGTQFDSSYDRGEPIEFVCGAGMMIRGFDAAVANMEVGQTIKVHLEPSEAYGMINPNAIFNIEIADLPGSEELEAGQRVYLQNQIGQPIPVTVVAIEEGVITFDANHEMAGKELNFEITLEEIK